MIRKFLICLLFILSSLYSSNANRFWLSFEYCGTQQTVCCCKDGNSRVCYVPAYQFVCLHGGIFHCSGIGGCQASGQCEYCCNPCYAGGGGCDSCGLLEPIDEG